MLIFIWILIYGVRNMWLVQGGIVHNPHHQMGDLDERAQMGKMLVELAEDILKEQATRSGLTDIARYDNMNSAAYEVGYMTQMIHEHYRRMLQKWLSVKLASFEKFYNIEMILFLEEIEHLYFAIKHETHMLHEVERKYKIKTGIDEEYEEPPSKEEMPSGYSGSSGFTFETPPGGAKLLSKAKSFKVENMMKGGLIMTTKPRKNHFKNYYGWEMYEWHSSR